MSDPVVANLVLVTLVDLVSQLSPARIFQAVFILIRS